MLRSIIACRRRKTMIIDSAKLFINPVSELQEFLFVPVLRNNEKLFMPTENEMHQAEKMFVPSQNHSIDMVRSTTTLERAPTYNISEVRRLRRYFSNT